MKNQESKSELPPGSASHDLGLYDEYLKLIENGSKTLDIRNKFWQTENIKAGDLINFAKKIQVKVTAVREYPDIGSALEHENPASILPGKTEEELIIMWKERFPNSTSPILVFEIEFNKKINDHPRH